MSALGKLLAVLRAAYSKATVLPAGDTWKKRSLKKNKLLYRSEHDDDNEAALREKSQKSQPIRERKTKAGSGIFDFVLYYTLNRSGEIHGKK